MKKVLMLIGIAVLLAACSQQATPVAETPQAELTAQAGSWQKLGGALDFTAEKNAVAPQLVLDRNGKLVAAWLENNNGLKVYLERWTGTRWESFGPGVPTNVGLFSLAFDTTNSPLIITPSSSDNGSIDGCSGDSVVLRRDSKTGAWSTIKILPNAARSIASDKKGFVYIVTQEAELNENVSKILSWDGKVWKTVNVFRRSDTIGGQYNPFVCRISFNSLGQMVVVGAGQSLPYAFYTYSGKSWESGFGYDSIFNVFAFDKQNRLVTHIQGQVTRNNQNLGEPFAETFIQSLSVDNLNRPIIATRSYTNSDVGDIFVKRWSGSTWLNLGSAVDRVTTRFADLGQVLVSNDGTIYTAWQECVGVFDPSLFSCTNYNVYVSKYVP
jgi:hypothetical protein